MTTAEDYSVTSVIIHRPLKKQAAAYEAWLKEILPIAQTYPGHRGVNVIRPHGGGVDYTIVLHFDTEANLTNWLSSEVRNNLIDKVRPLLDRDEKIEVRTGLEFWFTPTAGAVHAPPYKQFIITLSAIYPLTLLVPALTHELVAAWPHLLKVLFNDSIVVASMAFIIMPRYVRLISGWLYRH